MFDTYNVANPPYVSAIEFSRSYPKPYRTHLTGNFQTAQGAWDLYVLFFERGLTLIKSGDMLAFITPNKYLSAGYAVALREFFLQHSQFLKLVDLSSVPVFTSVMVYPSTHISSSRGRWQRWMHTSSDPCKQGR